MVKKSIKKLINNLGYEIKPKTRKSLSPIKFWEQDQHFIKIYEKIKRLTVASNLKCYTIYQILKQCSDTKGDIAEIGVYKGGTACLIKECLVDSNKSIYLFDTFKGIPEPDFEKDPFYFEKTEFFKDTSLASIKKMFAKDENIFVVDGKFPETSNIINDNVFSFVHVDVDVYKSVMDCCLFFYPRLVKGGILLFDDYGDYSCPGAKIAVDKFFIDKAEHPIYLPTGQCVVLKK